MVRHLLAATAALLVAVGARAQAPARDAAPAAADPKVEALVKAAVEKASRSSATR